MVVVIKAIPAIVGDVKIVPTVVVVISSTHALSPASRGQAGLNRHVAECSVVVIAVKAIARGVGCGFFIQPSAVHQKDVGPTVVIVIEDRNSGAGGFDDVFFRVDAAENFLHGQAGLLGDVDEVCDWRRHGRRSFWLLANGRAGEQEQKQN